MANPSGKARSDIDWQLAYFLFRHGNFGYTRIARLMAIPPSTIREHALRHNWTKPTILDTPTIMRDDASLPQNRVSRAGRRVTAQPTSDATAVNLSYFSASPRAVKRLLADSRSVDDSQGTTNDAP